MGNDRHRKTTFLPMLCSSSRSSIHIHDPFSPRISCTGQIKRHNKIAGIPTPQLHHHHRHNNVKYLKLKRLFSSSSSSNSSPTATKKNEPMSTSISIEELDPPLPVIKRAPKDKEEKHPHTLWERRSGGVELRSLQLQQIQINRHCLQPITTV
ncbi:hypothetical protein SLEP1_g2068 [Rubroshorea leprosula]|uniref:Uncharacterized protein n=1 Tax=Rubroshorea leprosula TaxID=152421 RepID=A0AAV5HFX7_9ROSI|nr:hypothetical protein SLEP1_g2068 [Rubroshorea leprosula]